MKKRHQIILATTLAGLAIATTGYFILQKPAQQNLPETITATFDQSDLKTTYELTSPNIDLATYATGATLNITTAGEYILSGTLTDGQIIINVKSTEKVQLFLSNTHINSDSGPAILVENADKVILTLVDNTTNTITDSQTNTRLGDSGDRDAAIFSHDDLTINGNGSLIVTANYNDAIESRDDLKITGGNITITAVDAGLFGNKSLEIKDATLSVTSDGDSIHSDGDLIIESGILTLSSGDDGIHADTTLAIHSGTINITDSYEGLEATDVIINNGTITISATDDGINGAGGTDTTQSSTTTPQGRNRQMDNFSSSTGTITINGGTLTVSAATSGNGDGLDANGNLTITGGDLLIKIPARTFDYATLDADGQISITGGTVRSLSQNGTYTDLKNTTSSGAGAMPRR